jgi:hypothetical protein
MSCDDEISYSRYPLDTQSPELEYVWLIKTTQRNHNPRSFTVQRLGTRDQISRHIETVSRDMYGIVSNYTVAVASINTFWLHIERDISGIGTATWELVLGTEDDAMFRM